MPRAEHRAYMDSTGDGSPPPATVREHRPPKPWERERDHDVLRLAMDEWARLPEPRPDYAAWLHGVSTALLLLRQGTS